MAETTDENMNEPTVSPDAESDAPVDAADEDATLHEGEVLAPEADDADRPEPLVGDDPAQHHIGAAPHVAHAAGRDAFIQPVPVVQKVSRTEHQRTLSNRRRRRGVPIRRR